jgi:RNA polymerase sigma factor (sigma-70 family)
MQPEKQSEWLAERFEENRGHLRAVAYPMLGSASEADDAVQEASLRLSRSDASTIENLGGWLTTVVSRVCLDMLRSRTAKREEALDVNATEPIATSERQKDPEQESLLADSVGFALLIVLDRLDPAERLAFVLHDMFAVSFDEIASILGRSPEAARQLASRARRRVQGAPAVPKAQVGKRKPSTRAKWRSPLSAGGCVLRSCLTLPTLLEIEIYRQLAPSPLFRGLQCWIREVRNETTTCSPRHVSSRAGELRAAVRKG